MSVFRVNLTQGTGRSAGGSLDTVAQSDSSYSVQRTVYLMGPNKINRKLRDGDTFTDSNYWKRYCATPTGPLAAADAMIEVVTDDSAPYVDGVESLFVVTYEKTILGATTHTTENNIIDFLTDHGGPALWMSVTVSGHAITCRINADTDSDFDIAASASHTFQRGDAIIERLTIDNSASGATTATVVIQAGILSRNFS